MKTNHLLLFFAVPLLITGCAPKLNNKANLERLRAAQNSGNTPSPSADSLSIVQFDSPPTAVAGGSVVQIQIAAKDSQDSIQSYILQYSEDSNTFTDIAQAAGTDSSIPWSVPKIDRSQVVLKLIAKNTQGLQTSQMSKPFNIDSTPPSPPTLSLTSSRITSNSTVTFNTSPCIDIDSIFITNSTQAPLASDSAWQKCIPNSSSQLSYHLTTEGNYSLYAWSKDAVGNISLSSSSPLQITYDITPPVAPSLILESGSFTRLTKASFTVNDCTDMSQILINESSSTPSASASGWFDCNTDWRGATYTLNSTQGLKTVYFWSKDTAGNVSAPSQLGITLDTVSPNITAVQVQSGLTVDVTFSETMGTGVTTPSNYTLSGSGKGTLSAQPNSVALVSGNKYRLTWSTGEMLNGGDITIAAATAQDLAGNSINSSGTHTAGGIGTPPSVPSNLALITPATSPGRNSTPTIRVSGVTAGDTIALYTSPSCSIVTLKASATSSGSTIDLTSSNLVDATYTFYSSSTDSAGNSSACSSASLTYVVDTVAPTLAITTPVSNYYVNNIEKTSVTVSGSCSDNGQAVHISATDTGSTSVSSAPTCNTGSSPNWTTSLNFTSLVDGPISLAAFQNDAAGNTGNALGVSIHKDTAAPTVSTVSVQTGLTIDVAFSEAMGTGITTASNYTLSGTGKGTLSSHPNSVSLISGNTYRLAWNSGKMHIGGDATISVAIAADLAGNPISSNGTHTGGGTGTVPSSPIALTLMTPSSSPGNNTTPIIRVTGVITGDTVSLYSDSSCSTLKASGTASGSIVDLTTSALTQASYTFYAKDTDEAGNDSNCSSASLNYILDTTPPTVSVTNPAPSSYVNNANKSSVTVSGSCSENGRPITLSATDSASVTAVATPVCNTGSNPNWSSSLDLTGLTDGTVTLAAIHTDAASNLTNATSVTIIKDVAIPVVSTVAVQSGLTIDVTFSEAMGSGITTAMNYTLSGTGKGTLSAQPNSVALVSGNKYRLTWSTGEMFNGGDINIAVTSAQDLAGNIINSDSTQIGGGIGTAPASPTGLTLITPVSSPGNVTTPTIQVSGVTSGDIVSIYTNSSCTPASQKASATAAGATLNLTSSALTDATYTFYANSKDTAGNTSSCSSANVVYALSTGLPVVTIDSPTTNSYVNNSSKTSVTVSGSCSENGRVISLTATDSGSSSVSANPTCNTASNPKWSTTLNFTSLVDGTITLAASHSDAASNTGYASNVSVSKDTVSPTVATVAVQTGLTVDVTFSETLASGATTAANYTVSGTGKGTLSSHPTSVSLVSGNKYRLTWSSGEMYNGGDINIAVASTQDPAGNPVSSNATHTGGGIGTAPAAPLGIALLSPATSPGTNTTPTLRVSGVTSGDTVAIYTSSTCASPALKASGIASGTSIDLTSSSVTQASYTFFSNSTDAAGNVSTCSTANVTYTLDTTPPTLSITTPSAGSYANNSATVSFSVSGSCSENGRAVSITATDSSSNSVSATPSCNTSATPNWATTLNFTSLLDGTITLAATHTDAAGNSTHATSVNVTKDTTIPTVTVVAVQTGLTVDVTFSEALTTGVTTAANYTISGAGKGTLAAQPNSVALVSGNKYRLTWSTGEMLNGGDIVISVTSAQDVAGNVINSNGTHTSGGIGTAPTVSTVAVETGLTVDVTFSEAMGSGVTTATNYSVSGTGKGTLATQPTSVALVSGNKYRLTWSSGIMTNSGNITLTVTTAQDLAGNPINSSGTHTGGAIATPPTAPSALALSTPATSPGSNTTPTIQVNGVTSGNTVALYTSSSCAIPALKVSATASAATLLLTVPTLSDASYTFYANTTDAAGNTSNCSTANITYIVDTIAPTLSLTSLTAGQYIPGGQNYSVTWSATDSNFGANPIKLEYSSNSGSSWNTATSGTSNSGTYSWMTPAVNGNTYRMRVTASDAAGNTTVVSSSTDFAIDADAPTVTALAIVQSSPTDNNNIQLNLTASDPYSNITHFCFNYNSSTQPTLSHTCWTPVNNPTPGISPDLNITFSNFYYLIGFTPGVYTVYGWVRDRAGNISSLSSSGSGTSGVDRASITYSPGGPPVLSNVSSASTDTPSVPPVSNDLSATVGSDVYIKWNASGSTTPLTANPISLYYTTNDSTYTLIASGISNSTNSGCTITASETGCYKWTSGSPSSSYFRVRVVAQNTSQATTFAPATPMNILPPIKIIAGNTDPGLNGSASSAVFFNDLNTDRYSDTGSLLVTPGGTIYFRDIKRGILVVSPTDGVQKLLIPTTGTSTGDGGPITSATLRNPVKIALDFQNNILVFDYNRIRKIITSTNPMTISTIIGGGASTADGVIPLSVSIGAIAGTSASDANAHQLPFFATPNGDIYFMSGSYSSTPAAGGGRIRVYKAATGLVQSISLSGIGDSSDASQDLTTCANQEIGMMFDPTNSEITHIQSTIYHATTNPSCPGTAMTLNQYNPTTGVAITPYIANNNILYTTSRITGRDGNLYSTRRYGIAKYDSIARTWAYIVGTGTIGSCADGTLATSCNIDSNDAFITSQGQVYWMDRGLIRTVDSANKVVTITGQSFFYGDGGLATSARLNTVYQIGTDNTGAISLFDNVEFRFRKFTPGGNISTIAGNGTAGWTTPGQTAATQSVSTLYSEDRFTVDPATGDLYYYTFVNPQYRIIKLQMSTQTWVNFVGGGATLYSSADGTTGSNINLPNGGFNIHLLGFDGNNVLAMKNNLSGTTNIDSFMKLYQVYPTSNGLQTAFAGTTGNAAGGTTLCANGTAMSSCLLPAASIYFTGGNTLYDSTNSRWMLLTYNTKPIRTFTPGGTVGTLITLPNNAYSFAYKGGGSPVVFYCSASDGKIHKHNFTTDTTLTWPITSMSCAGKSMLYDSTNNIITFIFTQNGMYGIAQYINP